MKSRLFMFFGLLVYLCLSEALHTDHARLQKHRQHLPLASKLRAPGSADTTVKTPRTAPLNRTDHASAPSAISSGNKTNSVILPISPKQTSSRNDTNSSQLTNLDAPTVEPISDILAKIKRHLDEAGGTEGDIATFAVPNSTSSSSSSSLSPIALPEHVTIVNNKNFLAEEKVAARPKLRAPYKELDALAVDCEYSEWTSWTQCSTTCGGGTQTRERVIARPAEHGGEDCRGSSQQERGCSFMPCPVAQSCQWSSWTDWSACSRSCSGGTQTRTRYKERDAFYGGQPCANSDTDTRPCNEQGCVVNCEWQEWGLWSQCTRSCGGGRQSRRRDYRQEAEFGGQTCDGPFNDERDCNTHPCPVDCEWSEWEQWEECSVTCGGGRQSRIREPVRIASFGGKECVGSGIETRNCNAQPCPVDCKWRQWGEWSECSLTCGTGRQTRYRLLDAAEFGGEDCTGSSADVRTCNVDPCPVNCRWAEFSAWLPCTTSCGGGQQTRNRARLINAVAGGKPCEGASSETTDCNTALCPCYWEAWSSWSPCSKSCDGGAQRRSRDQRGGGHCSRTDVENRQCNVQPCVCEASAWSQWSTCSASCGGGLRQRIRYVTGGARCPGEQAEKEPCNLNACAPCPGNCIPHRFGVPLCCKGGAGCRDSNDVSLLCSTNALDQRYPQCANVCG